MTGILAGILAAAAAWFVNSWVAARGSITLLYGLPLLEELLKTYAAIWLGGPVWFSHLSFGIIEAGYDLIKPARENVSSALISLLGHVGFGYLTLLVYGITGRWLMAVLAAAIVHTAWNYFVLKVMAK